MATVGFKGLRWFWKKDSDRAVSQSESGRLFRVAAAAAEQTMSTSTFCREKK